jgi:hypothetical protein
MYRHLWTIGPKEAMESMDYSYKEHFGKDLPTYVPREIIKLYLEGIFTCTIFIYSKLSHLANGKHHMLSDCMCFNLQNILITLKSREITSYLTKLCFDIG